MARSFRFLLAVVIVFGLVIGVGVGMWQRNNSAAPKLAQAANPAGSFGAGRGTATTGGSQGGQAAGQNAQGFAFGSVQSVDGKALVLTANNGTTKVTLADGAKIYKSSTVTADQIKTGDSVAVTSRTEQDGKVTAASIEAGPTEALIAMPVMRGQQAGGPGGPSGNANNAQAAPGAQGASGVQAAPAAQATPGARGQGNPNAATGSAPGNQAAGGRGNRLSGTVDAISASEITVKAADGTTTKVAISDQTAISRVAEASADELKAGINVIVAGKAGSDGTIAATMLRLTNGFGQQGGPGSAGAPSGSASQSR